MIKMEEIDEETEVHGSGDRRHGQADRGSRARPEHSTRIGLEGAGHPQVSSGRDLGGKLCRDVTSCPSADHGSARGPRHTGPTLAPRGCVFSKFVRRPLIRRIWQAAVRPHWISAVP